MADLPESTADLNPNVPPSFPFVTLEQVKALSKFRRSAYYAGLAYETCLLLPFKKPEDKDEIALILLELGSSPRKLTRLVKRILWWYRPEFPR